MSSPVVLVAGQGSAGLRHVSLLQEMGVKTVTVSRRTDQGDFQSIPDAVAQASPSHAILAGETALHLTQLNELVAAGHQGPILMEKPLYRQVEDQEAESEILDRSKVQIGYNLRFDPVVKSLREKLKKLESPVVSAQMEVGQYLADWRRGRDMMESYSASQEQGGGVLRDLSHELDLAIQLFGDWTKLTALGGQMSQLPIESDDCWTILASCQRCPILSIHLNYLDRVPLRRIRINATHQTLEADLIQGTVRLNEEIEKPTRELLDSYRHQLRAFLNAEDGLCSYAEGLQVMHQIREIEQASRMGGWVLNERLGD